MRLGLLPLLHAPAVCGLLTFGQNLLIPAPICALPTSYSYPRYRIARFGLPH